MRPTLRPLSFAAICAALFVLPVLPARAGAPAESPQPIPRFVASGPVRAGDLVELSWAPQDGHVEELELLLSLDGGRSWHVRVSPELPGSSVRYRWVVPNLPSADARIRVRMRVDARELEGPAGDRFAIESDPSRPLTRSLLSEGAWWTGLETPFDVGPGFGAGDAPSLSAPRAIAASEEGPRFMARPPVVTIVESLEHPGDITTPQSARDHASAPETFPLRN